ncbi:MAG: hypothetical protein P8178_13610 [Candidatus Thiodiazotropha sp.]
MEKILDCYAFTLTSKTAFSREKFPGREPYEDANRKIRQSDRQRQPNPSEVPHDNGAKAYQTPINRAEAKKQVVYQWKQSAIHSVTRNTQERYHTKQLCCGAIKISSA